MNYQVEFDQAENTNIAFGTTADYAYTLWLAKKKQIADLEYECDILVDKYHDEMKRARIPAHLRGTFIEDLFAKDKKRSGFARDFFLKQSFSEKFVKKHKPEFSKLSWFGYGRTSALIDLDIGHYLYTIEIPVPENIEKKDDKERLVGDVKFRVDRIHKSKLNEFVKEMESVQMPTYDWKACFEAIEQKESRHD